MNDQTEQQWIRQYRDDRGTGILLHDNHPFGIRKQIVLDMTYHDLILTARGQGAVECKWIPYEVAPRGTVRLGSCTPHACVDRCADPACICYKNVCR